MVSSSDDCSLLEIKNLVSSSDQSSKHAFAKMYVTCINKMGVKWFRNKMKTNCQSVLSNMIISINDKCSDSSTILKKHENIVFLASLLKEEFKFALTFKNAVDWHSYIVYDNKVLQNACKYAISYMKQKKGNIHFVDHEVVLLKPIPPENMKDNGESLERLIACASQYQSFEKMENSARTKLIAEGAQMAINRIEQEY